MKNEDILYLWEVWYEGYRKDKHDYDPDPIGYLAVAYNYYEALNIVECNASHFKKEFETYGLPHEKDPITVNKIGICLLDIGDSRADLLRGPYEAFTFGRAKESWDRYDRTNGGYQKEWIKHEIINN